MLLISYALFAESNDGLADESRFVSDTGFVDLQSGRVYYEIAGVGSPIVLIHGNYGDRRYWDAQFHALSGRHRVLRYDLLGFGASSPPTPDSMSDPCETLYMLLDALGIPRAHIVGFSMGSSIALEFAIRYPESTMSLVSIGPWISGYNPVPPSPAFDEYRRDVVLLMHVLRQQGAGTAAEHLVDVTFSDTIQKESTRAVVRELATQYVWWFQTHTTTYRRRSVQDLVTQLGDVAVPTLVVTSDHDLSVCKEIAQVLVAGVPQARLLSIPNAGHFIMIDCPDALNDALNRFFDSTS
jgi:pimeloyl-ACP methyl ester carboxylesterase